MCWPRRWAPGPTTTADAALAGSPGMGELGLAAADFDELKVLVGERLAEVEHRFD